ncbi:MAG: response regulator [Bacteroidota bacterium]
MKEEVFTNPFISVLLVDDNRVNQFLGKRLLKNIGVENVDLSSNGLDALNKIEEKKYDVLLTDIEMPGMNGYELSRTVRNQDKVSSRKMLIIALTGNASEDDKMKAQESGIDVFITKPYSPEDLLTVLNNHSKHLSPSLPIKEELKEIKVLHPGIQQIYTIFKNNQEDVRHFLMMLSFQIPELHKEINTGIQEKNWEQVFQATHKIKSPLKLFGDSELIQLLEQLSLDAKEKEKVDTFQERMKTISILLDKTVNLIHETLDEMI